MIEKIARNKDNTGIMNPNSPEQVKEKLEYYRSLFGKIHDLPEEQFLKLKADISTFFNLKPVHFAANYPERLAIAVRYLFQNIKTKKLIWYLGNTSRLYQKDYLIK